MFFRQRLAKEATLSYLLGCGSCAVGVAVDPVAGDEDWFIEEAARQNVKITHVFDTHVHADHYSETENYSNFLTRHAKENQF